jgi:hypothetical protein
MQFQAHQIDRNILTFLFNALQTLEEDEAVGRLLRRVAKVNMDLPSTLQVPTSEELTEIHQIIEDAWEKLPPTFRLFKGSITEEAPAAMEKFLNFRRDYSGLFVARHEPGPCMYRRRREWDPAMRRTKLLFIGRDNACSNALFKFLEDEDLYKGSREPTITLNKIVVFDRLRNQFYFTQVEIEVIQKKRGWQPTAHKPNDSSVFTVLSFKIREREDFFAAWAEVCHFLHFHLS